jgi:hypothetical protein
VRVYLEVELWIQIWPFEDWVQPMARSNLPNGVAQVLRVWAA